MTTCLMGMIKDTGLQIMLNEETDIFKPAKPKASVAYDPNAPRDEQEWYKIENFQERSKDFLENRDSFAFLYSPFESPNFSTADDSDFGKIEFLCGFQNDRYFFQRITPASQVKHKRISFVERYRYEEESKSIVIHDEADAIYIPSEETLYFKNISKISPIFKGINQLLREATEEEVKAFLVEDYKGYIKLVDFSLKDVNIPNRKLLTAAKENLEKIKEKQGDRLMEKLMENIDKTTDLQFDNGKFQIKSNSDLKALLYGLDERNYTTEISEEERIATGVQKKQK